MTETRLYFGMAKKNGAVSEKEWQGFVTDEIAPRFKTGFTVVDGKGFWLGQETKKPVSENSKVVIRLHGNSAAENENIAEIIANYKHDFQQEAVMRVDTPACAAF